MIAKQPSELPSVETVFSTRSDLVLKEIKMWWQPLRSKMCSTTATGNYHRKQWLRLSKLSLSRYYSRQSPHGLQSKSGLYYLLWPCKKEYVAWKGATMYALPRMIAYCIIFASDRLWHVILVMDQILFTAFDAVHTAFFCQCKLLWLESSFLCTDYLF